MSGKWDCFPLPFTKEGKDDITACDRREFTPKRVLIMQVMKISWPSILQQMRMTTSTSTSSLETDHNNLHDDIKSRIVLEHPIVYDTYDLCAYHREEKLRAFNVAMLKTILWHFEVPFRARDRKTDLIRLLKANVHPNGFARWCFCFETILLSNAVF